MNNLLITTSVWLLMILSNSQQCSDGTIGVQMECPDGSTCSEAQYHVCCDAECGICGGSGCSKRPGGSSNCCTSKILNANRYCDGGNNVIAPCIISTPSPTKYPSKTPSSSTTESPTKNPISLMGPTQPDPECLFGIRRDDVCCEGICANYKNGEPCSGSDCCGGYTCTQRQGGADSCCMSTIRESGRSCDNNVSPCIISTPTSSPIKLTMTPTKATQNPTATTSAPTRTPTGPTHNPTSSTLAPTHTPISTTVQYILGDNGSSKNWTEAEAWCNSMGSNLATFLYDGDMLNFQRDLDLSNRDVNFVVFVGINDRENEGEYKWVDGATCTLSTRWCTNFWGKYPNDTKTDYSDCGKYDHFWGRNNVLGSTGWSIYEETGKHPVINYGLMDIPCYKEKPFVCNNPQYIPTPHPTAQPTTTSSPTRAPTPNPTNRPTHRPSAGPTPCPVDNIGIGSDACGGGSVVIQQDDASWMGLEADQFYQLIFLLVFVLIIINITAILTYYYKRIKQIKAGKNEKERLKMYNWNDDDIESNSELKAIIEQHIE